MSTPYFTPELFKFLRELKRNNNREWFLANKTRYETQVRDPFLRFISDLGPRLASISNRFVADPRPSRGSLFRIYRDVRFSADKSPYKTHVAARFPHRDAGKKIHVPGFYLGLEPGKSFAAAGCWHPDPLTLRKIRDGIIRRPDAWKEIHRRQIPVEGDVLSRAPRGYPTEHPLIKDIRRKDFITCVDFTDSQVCGTRFLEDFVYACRNMSPLVEFLTRALALRW
ncbi:MAG TPA: DUF2461 domain-containing protein [Acidobacteriota bacterium]|jgi:uncharacterized protein (TIGR02453 family)